MRLKKKLEEGNEKECEIGCLKTLILMKKIRGVTKSQFQLLQAFLSNAQRVEKMSYKKQDMSLIITLFHQLLFLLQSHMFRHAQKAMLKD
ncbi:hypothetical protein X777_01856 [Ooceraea biroi]|uniref:Uncharacterized protein n=1 Tax=Ooceraea biroi TaxID=2015173 RepID=A0A026X478_OOCBI|nr:hypothetical protein X777_01856 [Ooceraea biroi]